MIVPDAPTSTTYRCRVCKRWWTTAPIPVSCCVIHSPGSCCHYGETESKPEEG